MLGFIRETWEKLNIIRRNAKLYAEVSNEDVQIYQYLENGKIMYNFEPVIQTNKKVIETIKL